MKRRNLQKMVSIESTAGIAVALLDAELILQKESETKLNVKTCFDYIV